MKTIIAITILSTGLLWGCQSKPESQSKQQPKMDHEMSEGKNHDMDHDHSDMAKTENVAYYTCPMESHKHIHSDAPGSCSECGMALVAAVEVNPDQADYYGCPMPSHSHVRSDKAGQCNECGMNLKPYKLQEIDKE